METDSTHYNKLNDDGGSEDSLDVCYFLFSLLSGKLCIVIDEKKFPFLKC